MKIRLSAHKNVLHCANLQQNNLIYDVHHPRHFQYNGGIRVVAFGPNLFFSPNFLHSGGRFRFRAVRTATLGSDRSRKAGPLYLTWSLGWRRFGKIISGRDRKKSSNQNTHPLHPLTPNNSQNNPQYLW
jgi:hypothetical protein